MQTKILTEEEQLSHASHALLHGEVVAFPTETVYGLGASIFQEKGIKKVFSLKGRPADNPLIVHIHSLSQIEQIAKNVPKEFYQLAKVFFPGPLTILLQKSDAISPLITASLPTVGVRMPQHPFAKKLLELTQDPLAAPSANLSGKPSPTTYKDVLEDFDGKIPYVVDGGSSEIGVESTVLNLSHEEPEILRPGVITASMIEKVIQKKVSFSKKAISPGMKYRHYSPKAKIRFFTDLFSFYNYAHQVKSKNKTFFCTNTYLSENSNLILLTEKNLYSCFREADRQGYEEIVIFCDHNYYSPLYDRLVKASQ